MVIDRGGASEWDSSAVAADVATLGGGTVVGAICNVILVFLVPKVVGISDYGRWRLFMLYGAYAGLLHLGLLDGALLKWAGQPLSGFRGEILPTAKFLVWQHMLILGLLAGVEILFLRQENLFIGLSVLVFAVVYNLTTLLQFGLQAGRRFRPVAVSTAAPALLLLIFVGVHSLFSAPTYSSLIVFYIAAWAGALIWLFIVAKPATQKPAVNPNQLGKAFIGIGWPILLVNISFVFVQRLDRFVVSWAANIESFAEYSLAGSALAVPFLVIQAAYNVFFPHLAGAAVERRAEIYRTVARLLLLAWILSLSYYFALDAFVKHVLPRYLPSLPIAEILMLGVVFLANVQILHMSLAYLNGRQKRFLIRTVAVVILGLALAALAAFMFHSLTLVADAELLTAGIWWAWNEWSLRDLTGQRPKDWFAFLLIFVAASSGYWVAVRYGGNALGGALLYLGAVVVLIGFGLPREFGLCMKFLTEHWTSMVRTGEA